MICISSGACVVQARPSIQQIPSHLVGLVVWTVVIFQPDKCRYQINFTAFESIPTPIAIDQTFPAAIAPVTSTYSVAQRTVFIACKCRKGQFYFRHVHNLLSSTHTPPMCQSYCFSRGSFVVFTLRYRWDSGCSGATNHGKTYTNLFG